MKRIVITGPEASGKSILTEAMAEYFDGKGVSEYSRFYLQHLPRKYQIEDLAAIAYGQENLYYSKMNSEPNKKSVFIDTWAIVLEIWAIEKFAIRPDWIDRWLERVPIDLFLLCKPDLPWTPDPLRENPHDRDRLFEAYVSRLESYQFPYRIVSGKGEQRSECAKQHLKELLR